MATGLKITKQTASEAFAAAGYECNRLNVRNSTKGSIICYTLTNGVSGSLKYPECRFPKDGAKINLDIRLSVTNARRNNGRRLTA